MTQLDSQLFDAVKNKNVCLVKQLIELGANVNAKNEFGENAIYWIEDVTVAEFLIEKGINFCSKTSGWTALHNAVHYDHSDIAKLLVKHGADINAKTDMGRTPLHSAVKYGAKSKFGDKELIKFLIENGANLNVKDEDGYAPIAWSIMCGEFTDVVELLISYGANINITDNNGKTPLDLAISHNHSELIDCLKSHGAVTSDKLSS